MADPFVGEIKMFGGNFAPAGWAFCDGQTLAISEYETLFILIGTTYGGDGESTFNLPDLRGRVPVHQGTGSGLSNRVIGEQSGVESVSLTVQQLPIHTHGGVTNQASSQPATSTDPAGRVFAVPNDGSAAYSTVQTGALAGAVVTASAGNGAPHNNMQPFQCVNYIISLFGVFPTQS